MASSNSIRKSYLKSEESFCKKLERFQNAFHTQNSDTEQIPLTECMMTDPSGEISMCDSEAGEELLRVEHRATSRA